MTDIQQTDNDMGDLRVRARSINKSFGDNHVLRGIDLDVAAGTTSVLIGPSGSGKTTILRSLNVLERPDSGTIRIDDVEVDFATLPEKGSAARQQIAALRAQSGMVFQAHNLFPHKTVLENVIEGPVQVQKREQDEAIADARELLEQVGLSDKADQYPFQLSGGQQQRVGIARALALKPRVMLFDEPTSALDPEMIKEVLDVMQELATEGTTMLVVTHEMGFARSAARRVVFMDEGAIVEVAPPEQFFTAPTSDRARDFLSKILVH